MNRPTVTNQQHHPSMKLKRFLIDVWYHRNLLLMLIAHRQNRTTCISSRGRAAKRRRGNHTQIWQNAARSWTSSTVVSTLPHPTRLRAETASNRKNVAFFNYLITIILDNSEVFELELFKRDSLIFTTTSTFSYVQLVSFSTILCNTNWLGIRRSSFSTFHHNGCF